jgi:hypothetical protein
MALPASASGMLVLLAIATTKSPLLTVSAVVTRESVWAIAPPEGVLIAADRHASMAAHWAS